MKRHVHVQSISLISDHCAVKHMRIIVKHMRSMSLSLLVIMVEPLGLHTVSVAGNGYAKAQQEVR